MADAVAAEGAALLGEDLRDLEGIARRLRAWDGPQGAKMALDGAAHDWVGRRYGLPVWRLLGLDGVGPPTSFTIGIATVEETVARVRRAPGFAVLQGQGGRARRPRTAGRDPRRHRRPDADRRQRGLDVRRRRASCCPALRELGVELIEQPFPAADLDAFARLPRAARPAAGVRRRGLPGPGLGGRRSPATPTAS